MRRLSSIAALGGMALGCALLAAAPLVAEAHETRSIAEGQFQIVIGFINEPVFAGDKSGLEFWVTEVSAATPTAAGDEGVPVEGLAETLQAEVIFGDQSLPLPLTAMWDEPGGYYSVFFPMQPGDYTFRLFGTIGDTEIDEAFTSSPEGFNSVQDPAPLQFPAAE
jgi:hypothetical protein